MINNAIIKGVAYYHPDNKVDNEYFIEHFKKQGKDISHLLEVTGRSSRYICDDENETIITMGYKAAVKVLEKCYIKPSQLNLIAFSSGTPEYVAPSNAIKIHMLLGAGQKAAVYDINANCAGMLYAFEQVCRIMKSNLNIKYALIVACDQFYRYSRFTEEVPLCNFGDNASAMIVENVFDTDRGFIDSDFYTNSSNHDKILLPATGMSSAIHNKKLDVKDKLVKWTNFNLDGAFFSAKISIQELLFKNNLTKKDVKMYFISQFSKKNIDLVCRELEEDPDKFKFVGDEFGYTGTSSPILAYAKYLEQNEFSIGDNIVFWTVGAGTTCVCILYRY